MAESRKNPSGTNHDDARSLPSCSGRSRSPCLPEDAHLPESHRLPKCLDQIWVAVASSVLLAANLQTRAICETPVTKSPPMTLIPWTRCPIVSVSSALKVISKPSESKSFPIDEVE